VKRMAVVEHVRLSQNQHLEMAIEHSPCVGSGHMATYDSKSQFGLIFGVGDFAVFSSLYTLWALFGGLSLGSHIYIYIYILVKGCQVTAS